MKFVQRDLGDAAEASSGGQWGHGREIFLLVACLAAILALSYALIGWIGELLVSSISVETERKWFGRMNLVNERPAHDEATAAKLARADRILEQLVQRPQVPKLDYRLTLIPGREPNAFAFPGGTIGVTEPLLDLLDNDVALAFVLGHELGHFAHRDHLRGLGRGVSRSVVWALLFGTDGSAVIAQNVDSLLELRHSRSCEADADRFGLTVTYGVFGKTEGTERLFQWLEKNQSLPQWTAMLTTHPHATERLERLRQHSAELEAKNR